MKMTEIQSRLFELSDEKYAEFSGKILPTLDKDRIIGVRTPALRAYAKELYKTESARRFMAELPHEFFEENNLHAYFLDRVADFDEALAEVERFLPYVDNWATCDGFFPKAFRKEPERLLPHIREWLKSDGVYTVRFAIGALMREFLDEKFEPEYLALVAEVDNRDEYYIQMMQAWYFATALAKQYDAALPYIKDRKLGKTVHRMTVRKARESFRIPEERKNELKEMMI